MVRPGRVAARLRGMTSIHERPIVMIDSSPGTRPGPGNACAGGPALAAAPSVAEPGGDAPEPPSPGERRRLLPRLIVLLLVAGATGGGAWYYFDGRKKDDGRLVLQGNVDVRQVNLAFKVDGRIETLAVDEGDPVKAGQVVATLDARYFDDELRLARARRDNLKAVLQRLEHGSRPEEIAEAQGGAGRAPGRAGERAAGAPAPGSPDAEGLGDARGVRQRAGRVRARPRRGTRTAEEALRLAEIGPRQEDIDAARAQLRGEEASRQPGRAPAGRQPT